MSQTYASVIVLVVTNLLTKYGFTVGSAEVTTTIQTLVNIASCAWILVRRYQAGGVSALGIRK